MIEENDSFAALMGDVEPLSKPQSRQLKNQPSYDTQSQKRQRQRADQDIISEPKLGNLVVENISPEQNIHFFRAGLDKASIRRLRKGQCHSLHKIDLHGHTVNRAREQVWSGITQAQQHQTSVLLIVHGKGGHQARYESEQEAANMGVNTAIIKSHVNHWLRQIDVVMGFCSAKPQDGGAGAVYVLLKKSRKEP